MIVQPSEPLDPVVVARALGRHPLPCWLVSPGAGELTPVREFLASDPVAVVRGDSVAALEQAWQQAQARWAAGDGVPVGIGYLSYDLGRQFMRLRSTAPPASDWPGLEFRFYDAFWVRDLTGAGNGRAEIWAVDAQAAAVLAERLRGAGSSATSLSSTRFSLTPLRPTEPPTRHLRAVERVLEYLRAGDAYQVNLARRLVAQSTAEGPVGLELFARLRAQTPAPHALWLADPATGRALVGNSPERFLRADAHGMIETAPIKGTRPRPARASGPGVEADQSDAGAIARVLAELSDSAKDRAEHVMIVDLERNDLGRICQVGSVEVIDPMRGLVLPSVLHLVSTVRGRLRSGVGFAEILRATFPGGSITGAPKRRAMEIIDELEPAQRGPYTGATGWLGAAGDFDLAVAIRTAWLVDESLSLWVGGGIVADSSPEAELAETEVKARAFASLAAGEVM